MWYLIDINFHNAIWKHAFFYYNKEKMEMKYDVLNYSDLYHFQKPFIIKLIGTVF